MPWSKEQEIAINSRGKNLLVAAAAGSGKTAVLVERIIRRLTSGKLDISELLVVTFTNAAAAEMRQRIRQALEKALKESSNSSLQYRLQRQLLLLDNASISTVHAFCRSIISRYFHHLDLDPKYRLAGEQEIALLQADVLKNLLENEYEKEQNDDFLYFADAYGNESGDQKLGAIILKTYNCAIAQPFPTQWLNSLKERFYPNTDNLKGSQWGKLAQAQLSFSLEKCRAINERMDSIAASYGEQIEAIEADSALIEKLSSFIESDWESAYQLLSQKKLFATWDRKTALPEDVKNYLKDDLRGKIKKCFEDLKGSYFAMTPQDFVADLKKQAAHVACVARLASDFMAAFAKAKQEKQIVDYNDLEHFALKILAAPESTEKNLIATQAALRLQRSYKEIMVDEYQDTNGVQEAIIRLLAGNMPKTFLVGDVKQGIYRFRAADPSLFLQKYEQYPKAGPHFLRVDLAKNFRSRQNILKGINFIFAQLWQKNISELDYDDEAALSCGLIYPQRENALSDKLEIALPPLKDVHQQGEEPENTSEELEEKNGIEQEAAFIARRIKELFDANSLVFDKETKDYRPLRYRDIVILLRAAQNKSDIILDTLQQNDIPAYGPVSGGYFSATEIELIISFLQVIDNPHQDIALAAVLLAPFGGFLPDELAKIRLFSDEDLCEALKAAASDEGELGKKCLAFWQRLDSYRTLARRMSVPEFLSMLYEKTGYYDYCAGLPGGALRQANLRSLIDRAYAYEATNYRGLFRFLQFVGKMKKAGTDLAAARTLGENEDVVRIMTIHASKGLEFPVVFLAGTGSRFNLRDINQPLLIHKDYGLAPYIYDLDYNARYPTFARHVLTRILKDETLAEELRILYVALTRAREKLIITASPQNLAKKLAAWQMCQTHKTQVLPAYTILEAQCPLDWIMSALSRHEDLMSIFDEKKPSSLRDADCRWQISYFEKPNADEKKEQEKLTLFAKIAQEEPLPPSEAAPKINALLSRHYPHALNPSIPAKLTVTEIKERFAESGEDENAAELFLDNSYESPLFLKEQTLTGRRYGTLMHKAMQHITPFNANSPRNVKGQLKALLGTGIFSEQELKSLNYAALAGFFASPLGKKLQKAPLVRHELPFSRLVPARLFYPKAKDESIFIQGVADLIFGDENSLTLVDYKTDNCSAQEAAQRYKIQLLIYAFAVEQILRRPVTNCYLYLFHDGSCVEIKKTFLML